MPKERTLKEAYENCKANGIYLPQKEVDKPKIKTMLKIAEEDLETIEDLKNKDRYNTTYKLSYDILHTLTEAFLNFDKIKSTNHQCLFTYLCIKHPELELDWNFFEKIRTKRNGIHYYGSSVVKNDWKEINLQIKLYIKTLQKAIKRKLEQQ